MSAASRGRRFPSCRCLFRSAQFRHENDDAVVRGHSEAEVAVLVGRGDRVDRLDPAAHAADARAEAEVFTRFKNLAEGTTAVLISHRFSTVRMADRILVIEDGRVVEDGSHELLVASGGRYAELFSLQAAGYR